MQVCNVSFSYGEKEILKDISFSIAKGKITTILGGNGCGKSTLFQVMTRNLQAKSGAVFLEGENIANYKLKEFAKKVAIVHQYNTVSSDVTVRQLVSYGRLAYRSIFGKQSSKDEEAIIRALTITNLLTYQNALVSQLSGGQKQRAWIAMALAQESKVLFLDEPTTYLDVRYQVEILQLVKQLKESLGITVIMVLHDINQAIAYSDVVIGLKEGRIYGMGSPKEVIEQSFIEALYGIQLPMLQVDGKQVVLTI